MVTVAVFGLLIMCILLIGLISMVVVASGSSLMTRVTNETERTGSGTWDGSSDIDQRRHGPR